MELECFGRFGRIICLRKTKISKRLLESIRFHHTNSTYSCMFMWRDPSKQFAPSHLFSQFLTNERYSNPLITTQTNFNIEYTNHNVTIEISHPTICCHNYHFPNATFPFYDNFISTNISGSPFSHRFEFWFFIFTNYFNTILFPNKIWKYILTLTQKNHLCKNLK